MPSSKKALKPELGAVVPLSPRGERARARLVHAARAIFERDGFVTARITEIAATAGLAVGSFYTYFPTKEAIFLAVVGVVDEEFADPVSPDVTDPLERIAAGNAAYVRRYKKSARILAALQHQTFEDEGLYGLRQRSRQRFIRRAERLIRRLQDDGLASRDVQPAFVATALSGMVHSFCYETFSFGSRSLPREEDVSHGLTAIWYRALGISSEVIALRSAPVVARKKTTVAKKRRAA